MTPVSPRGPCTLRPGLTWCALDARITTNAGPTLRPGVADKTCGALHTGLTARPGVPDRPSLTRCVQPHSGLAADAPSDPPCRYRRQGRWSLACWSRHAARHSPPARSDLCALNTSVTTNAGPTLWPGITDKAGGTLHTSFAARPGIANRPGLAWCARTPVSPRMPVRPCGPVSPTRPVEPCTPVSPRGPV